MRIIVGMRAVGSLSSQLPLHRYPLYQVCCLSQNMAVVIGSIKYILNAGKTQRLLLPQLRRIHAQVYLHIACEVGHGREIEEVGNLAHRHFRGAQRALKVGNGKVRYPVVGTVAAHFLYHL